MKLEHIVVATDASEVGREAYAAALDLAARTSARVTVMRAIAGRRVPVGAYADGSAAELERLEEWVSSVATWPTPPHAPCSPFHSAHGATVTAHDEELAP